MLKKPCLGALRYYLRTNNITYLLLNRLFVSPPIYDRIEIVI